MTTSMHRLQISLPRSQIKYLTDRARREGVSIAELIRRLIHSEAETLPSGSIDSLREIIGIGEERDPLIDNIPVSEKPDLYIAEEAARYRKTAAKKRTKCGSKRS